MFLATSLHDLSVHLAGRPAAITIGVFDGIHLGHQALIRRTVEAAAAGGLVSVVITFPEHPLALLAPPFQPSRLINGARRAGLLQCMSVDVLGEIPFDVQFAATDAEAFVTGLVQNHNMRHLVCGYDFTFGKGGRGNVELLRRLGSENDFQLEVVDPVRHQEINIKSTHIRDVLFNGNVEDAARLLGRPFELTGQVVTGRQQGRSLGFPTANLRVASNYLVPATGVYACAAQANSAGATVPAMVNIGLSPTFGENALTVEAHLIDWSGELVGEVLTVHLLQRLRNEQKFDSVDSLVVQLKSDRAAALKVYKSSGFKLGEGECPPAMVSN